jgi:hypothetical protein
MRVTNSILLGCQLPLTVSTINYVETLKAVAKCDELEQLMLAFGNHAAYRAVVAAASPPGVPYFGVCLKDLTFLHDGNPDHTRFGLVRCSFFGRNLLSRMPLVPTPARLKLLHACANGIPLGSPLFLLVHTVNCVQTLKVNIGKWRRIIKVLKDIGNFQGAQYNLIVVKEIQTFLESSLALDDDAIHQKSKALQPL